MFGEVGESYPNNCPTDRRNESNVASRIVRGIPSSPSPLPSGGGLPTEGSLCSSPAAARGMPDVTDGDPANRRFAASEPLPSRRANQTPGAAARSHGRGGVDAGGCGRFVRELSPDVSAMRSPVVLTCAGEYNLARIFFERTIEQFRVPSADSPCANTALTPSE